MLHKRKAKMPAHLGVNRGFQLDKAVSAESSSRSNPIQKPSYLMTMQQSYGNRAMEHMVRSVQGEYQQRTQSFRRLKDPYARLAGSLEQQARQEQRNDLLGLFKRLTPAQQQAALMATFGSVDRLHHSNSAPVDWEKLADNIRAVDGVKLQDTEPELEADANEHGAKVSAGTVDVTGLLAPYKDITLWLNYKANKQGKADLMQYFESLSIPQKKIALHKMVNRKKLVFGDFAKSMTVSILLKQWVDWERMSAAMRKAMKIKITAADDQALESIIADAGSYRVEEQEKEEEEDAEGFTLAGLGLGKRGSKGKQGKDDPQADSRLMLSDPTQISWLLLGIIGGADDAANEQIHKKHRSSPEAIVDRYLHLAGDMPPKSRDAARKQELKKHGFHSARQCYVYLMTVLVAVIYDKGVRKRDKTFSKLITALGLADKKKPSPTKATVAQQLSLH